MVFLFLPLSFLNFTTKQIKMSLQGKVAYITGGTKGIGYGIAESLLEQGMKVAISGRSQKSVDEALKSCTKENVLGLVSDVSKLEDEVKAVKSILEKWGRLDVVMANAGVGHFAPIDVDPEAFNFFEILLDFGLLLSLLCALFDKLFVLVSVDLAIPEFAEF